MGKKEPSINVTEEQEPFAWKGVLLGCLPSSANPDKPKIGISNPHEELSSDDDDNADNNGLEDHEIFHALASKMNDFLNQARTQDGWSDKLGSVATGMFISSGLINSMSRGSKSVYEKLKSTKFEDIATTAGDIFAVMGKAHWAASGLLVVAAIIHNIQKLKRVDKQCIELLVSVNTVSTSLSRFTRLPHIPEEMKLTVNRAKHVISASAACCLSIIHSRQYHKFIFSSKNEEQVSSYKRELEGVQRDLAFQLLFADYSERHEPGGHALSGPKKNKNATVSGANQPSVSHPDGSPASLGSHGSESHDGGQTSGGKQEGTNDKVKCGQWMEKLYESISKQKPTRMDISEPNSEFEDVTDTETKIMRLLHLQTEEKAVAVFLCGEKDAGKSMLADKVSSNLQEKKKWKHVKIKISETERVQEGLVSDVDIVPGLRAEILKKLPGKGNEQAIENDGDWQNKLSARLTAVKNVFIFIDNVPSSEILKKLLPMNIKRGNHLRVLLTIRDKNVLSALDNSVYVTRLHVMKTLSYNEALEFFREAVPDKSYESVVRKIIKICKGYKKRMGTVREYLLKYYADDESFKRLSEWININQPNFTGLSEYLNCEEKFLQQSAIAKDALLDICSFFNGWEWHETACIIDDDVMEKLKELQLVNRESHIVSVPPPVLTYCLSRAKGKRITSATELHDVLAEKEEKFRAIKGIWLLQNKFPFHISSSQLDEMTELRVLALGDWTIVKGTACKTKFSQLRYFQVGRVANLPFNITQVDNLRFLDNNSQHYFETCSNKVPPTLRMLRSKGMKLKHYLDLKNLPEECQVTQLDIGHSDMEELPNDVCEIYALQKIFLNQCMDLKRLPKSFGKLKCLKLLDLSHCEKLIDLSLNFGWLRSLEKVNFSYCRHLKDLPDSMGLLSSVKEIDFSYCKSIEKLPKSFVKLSTLRVLKLRGCSHLLELPEGFEGLALEKLCLESCKRLKALHQRVGEASLSQKEVSLSWCLSVAELSKGFINLIKAQVEELILVDCMTLQVLPDEFSTELSRLKILNLSGCESLLRLPMRFHKLQYLEKLNLSSCEKLEESSIKLSRLSSLKEVNLSNCPGLEGSCLGSLSKIQNLTYLDIHGSPKLVDRWIQLNRAQKNCHLVVTTARPGLGSRSFSKSLDLDPCVKKELRRGIYEFFNGKWFFVDVNGGQFYPFSLEEGTTLAVIFDNNYQKQELQAAGKILDDLQATCNKLQVIHVGMTCVSELAMEVAGRHRVCSCDNYGAQVFFEKALSSLNDFDQTIDYAMIISDVEYRGNHKDFSGWTSITNENVRSRAMTMEVSKTEYLRLKELIESDRKRSNIELLRALLQTKEIKFLISSTRQVEIKELKGKFVFLLLSWLHNMEAEYQAFSNVYERLKIMLDENPMENNVDFEVVWIPIVNEGRGTRALHAKWVEEIKWPSIADPWSINPIVMHYFRRQSAFNKLPLLMAVSPRGIFHSDNLIPNTKKTEAEIKEKKLKEAEENRKVTAELTEVEAERKVREEVEKKVRETEDEIAEKRMIETTKRLYEFIEEEVKRKVREDDQREKGDTGRG